MTEVCFDLGKNSFQVMQHLVGFAEDIGGFHFPGSGINGYLTGYEQQVAGLYSLAIGPDRGRGIGGIDDLFFHGTKIGYRYLYREFRSFKYENSCNIRRALEKRTGGRIVPARAGY